MLCFDKELIGQWVANRVNGVFTPENSSCIGLLDKTGTVIAGVWYEGYTKTSIMTHIAIDGQMSKQFLATIFDYPFVQLGVNKLIGPTNSSNEDAMRFNYKLGFIEEARIKDAFPDGDMVLLTLTKDKCRFLGEKYGKERTISTATT
jgi:RimJ/RimL family protein N-acetyltransferase